MSLKKDSRGSHRVWSVRTLVNLSVESVWNLHLAAWAVPLASSSAVTNNARVVLFIIGRAKAKQEGLKRKKLKQQAKLEKAKLEKLLFDNVRAEEPVKQAKQEQAKHEELEKTRLEHEQTKQEEAGKIRLELEQAKNTAPKELAQLADEHGDDLFLLKLSLNLSKRKGAAVAREEDGWTASFDQDFHSVPAGLKKIIDAQQEELGKVTLKEVLGDMS